MFLSRLLKGLAVAAALAVSVSATAQAPAPAQASWAHSVWINPYGNVKVQTSDCGGKLCGWVVWATPQAEQEAREAGVQKLVGTELLKDYRPTGHNSWQGRVFVPDMGRSFFSTISSSQPGTLTIKGCVLGGLICKSQLWRKA